MIHDTPTAGKFRRLVRKLRPMLGDLPVSVDMIAVGLLERLWHIAITGAIRGDIGRFDNEEIAEMVGWHGDAGVLIELLVSEKWLDRDDEFRLLIHDWDEHAPRHIKANAAKVGGILKALRPSPNGDKDGTRNVTQPDETQPNGRGGPAKEFVKLELQPEMYQKCLPIAVRIARIVTGNENVRTDKLPKPDQVLCLKAAAIALFAWGEPWLDEILLSIKRKTKPPDNRWGHFRAALVNSAKRCDADFHAAETMVHLP